MTPDVNMTYAESVESISADFKQALINPIKELPEYTLTRGRLIGINAAEILRLAVQARFVVENQGGDSIMFQSLFQDSSTGHSTLAAIVAIAKRNDDFGTGGNDVLQGNRLFLARLLVPQDGRDDGLCIFAGLEW
jgi:acyl-CoA synthetase (NDP forming)